MSHDESQEQGSSDQTEEQRPETSCSLRVDEYSNVNLPSPTSSAARRRRRQPFRNRAASSEQLSSQLSHRLRDESAKLLDCLFDYLSHCPRPFEEQTSPRDHAQRGLTLPASAVGWLSLHLYPDDGSVCEDDQDGEELERDWWMEVPTRDRLPLIKFLLPRATHLRITSDEWPPPQKQNKAMHSSSNVLLSYPRSGLTSESPNQENRPFLSYLNALRNSPRLDLRVFPNLSVLLLDGVPPEWIVNISAVQDKLELLRVERGCIFNVATFLFPYSASSMDEATEYRSASDSNIDENPDAVLSQSETDSLQETLVYPKLTHLKLSHCSIGELSGLRRQTLRFIDITNDDVSNLSEVDHGEEERKDDASDVSQQQTKLRVFPPPLSLLPNLVSLSLANNELVRTSTALAGLSSLTFLSKLDLSFNHLSCMDDAFLRLGNLKVLLLSGNRIENARGLDRLYSLEHLSLDRNNIEDLADVAGLARLPELSTLDLYGNGLEKKNPMKYRVDMLNLFRECRFTSLSSNATYRHLLQILPILDGKSATKKEMLALRSLTFKHSIGSPTHSENLTFTPVMEEIQEDGILSPQSGTSRLLSHGSPLLQSPPPGTVVTVDSRDRIRRIRRRTRTRKAIIENGPVGRTASLREGQRYRADGHENLTMNFQENHAHLKLEIASLDKKDEPISRKVKFSVQDVISSLQVASAAPFKIEEPDDYSFEKDEESAAFQSRSEMLLKDEIEEAALEENTFSEVSPPDARDDAFSTAAADLSLLSLSTVKPSSENGNTDRDESFLSGGEMECEDQGGAYSSAAGESHAEENLSVAKWGVESDDPMDKENSALKDDESYGEKMTTSKNDSSSGTPKSREVPDVDEGIGKHVLQNISFPEHIWEDDASVPSSVGTNKNDIATELIYKTAEDTSVYDGPDSYRSLNVLVNLELYFRCFVFPTSLTTSTPQPWDNEADENGKAAASLYRTPRIQLCKADREEHCASDAVESREHFRHVWSEEIVACGKRATSRLAPNRTPRRGFHGDIVFSQGKLATVSECRKLIFCTSDAALYLISDYDAVTIQSQKKLRKRQFPLPIPNDALFEDAPWPHAVARHHIRLLHRITIGFGFQRLTLHFSAGEESGSEYTYVLLTCNKMRTISLLQQLQDDVKESTSSRMTAALDEAITIDNDDKQFLDALSAAVAPDTVGVVMHYQILQQRWKHGDRGSVRRACVVTDTKVFLLDEDYVGDGSSGASYEAQEDTSLADVSLKVVESAELNQIVEVHGADADPRSITIIIRPLSRLKRTHRWRLLCHDGVGAERLVEDVRKAISTTM